MNRFISGGIIAWAILPDHFHILLNPGEQDVSSLMVKTKLSFSMAYRKRIGVRKGRIWQYRFWDHLVRNENDMQACFDYIHSNPVKHGLSKSPFEWEYSSARDYLSSGHYDEDWMICDKDDLNLDFGE